MTTDFLRPWKTRRLTLKGETMGLASWSAHRGGQDRDAGARDFDEHRAKLYGGSEALSGLLLHNCDEPAIYIVPLHGDDIGLCLTVVEGNHVWGRMETGA